MSHPSPSQFTATDDGPIENERRGAVRYPCLRHCLVRPENAAGVGDWPGITLNISTTGICLAIPFSVSQGTVLVIEPWGPKSIGKFRAHVIRSWMDSFVWFHACQFANSLTDPELEDWLTNVAVKATPREISEEEIDGWLAELKIESPPTT